MASHIIPSLLPVEVQHFDFPVFLWPKERVRWRRIFELVDHEAMKGVSVKDQESEPFPAIGQLGFYDDKPDEEEAWRESRAGRISG